MDGGVRLNGVTPTSGHEAEKPSDGCDYQEDDAYPEEPVEGRGKTAHQKKNNCDNTSNDQKRVHGQHIPFCVNPEMTIFRVPDYAFLLLRLSYAGT
jgi:hypothetical protein